MAQIPVWLTGKGVTAATVGACTVAADGTLTDPGAPTSLLLQLDSVRVRSTYETEEISAMDAIRQHNVALKVSTEIELVEILKKGGANILAALYYGANSGVFKFALTRGAQTFTFYGQSSAYSEEINKGRSNGTLTVIMVDPNQGNPTYA